MHSPVDFNKTQIADGPESAKDGAGRVENKNFVKRTIVATNQRILVLKDIPMGIRCPNCPEHSFCPKGPDLEFGIKYTDLKQIVNFPQIPQKLALIY